MAKSELFPIPIVVDSRHYRVPLGQSQAHALARASGVAPSEAGTASAVGSIVRRKDYRFPRKLNRTAFHLSSRVSDWGPFVVSYSSLAPAAVEAPAGPGDSYSKIEEAYQRIARLLEPETASEGRELGSATRELERAFEQLRELQEIEADAIALNFKAKHPGPTDSGEVLERTAALLERHADSSSDF